MNIEKKLDKIIDLLYDENILHWKEVPTTDFIAFAKKKFNIDWSDAEMNFILSSLENDGYIIRNKIDSNSTQIPTYSLTTKGVQMKRKGGFSKMKLVEDFKNAIILWGSAIALIVSIITIYDFVHKTWFLKVSTECCKSDSKTSNNNPVNVGNNSNNSFGQVTINEKLKVMQRALQTSQNSALCFVKLNSVFY